MPTFKDSTDTRRRPSNPSASLVGVSTMCMSIWLSLFRSRRVSHNQVAGGDPPGLHEAIGSGQGFRVDTMFWSPR